MNANVSVGVAELIEQLVDVLRSNDVVDGVEFEYAVAARKLVELLNDVVNSLRTKFHSRAIQTAERAMIFHAPPTATRGFDRQQNAMGLVVVFVTALLARVKILVEIGNGSLVHVGEVRSASCVSDAAIVTPHHAHHARHRLALVKTPDRLRQAFVTIAAVNVIDLRTAFHDLVRDIVFERSAAHHDRNMRITLFECSRESDTGKSLLKDD